jgi:hypothetical protein
VIVDRCLAYDVLSVDHPGLNEERLPTATHIDAEAPARRRERVLAEARVREYEGRRGGGEQPIAVVADERGAELSAPRGEVRVGTLFKRVLQIGSLQIGVDAGVGVEGKGGRAGAAAVNVEDGRLERRRLALLYDILPLDVCRKRWVRSLSIVSFSIRWPRRKKSTPVAVN